MDRLLKILKHTRVLFATAEELQLMTGEKADKAAERIIQCGTEIVVCKRSGQGSEIITADDFIRIPVAQADHVIDKTGAGDVYAAGFIAGMLSELPLELCGKLASKAAALSISAYGREKYPDKSFLRRFIDRL